MMKMLVCNCLFLLLTTIATTDAESLASSCSGECPGGGSFCPGDEVTYTCEATGTLLGNNVWILPGGTCSPSDRISIDQGPADLCSNFSGDCGPFTAANAVTDGTVLCVVSILSFTASPELRNSFIECINSNNIGTDVEIGNATVLITGPLSFFSVSVASCSVDSVTLVWEDTSSVPTRYVLSATPTVENCEPSCTVSSPTMEYTFTGLEGGVMYSVAVQADNCNGMQQGEEVTVDVSLSDVGSLSLNVCPTYDGLTNTLESVEATWNDLDPVVAVPGGMECASVMQYELMLNDDRATILPSECMSGQCTYSTNESFDTTPVNVALMAVGLNAEERKFISTTNNLISVNINATSSPVMATCSFLSGFTGDALCRVDFTGPDGVTYSTERGSAGESVTVELTLNGAALLPNTTYSYQATVEDSSPCVRVTGQFTTGDYKINCIVDPLGISDASVCDAGQMAAVIPNGMFSCDGLTPDSTATFTCDDRSSVVLECQLNGAWNDTAPTCGAVSSGLSTGAVVGIAVGMLLLLLVAGAVTALLVWFCCCRDPPKKVVSVERYQGGGDAVAMKERKPNTHSQPSGNKETRRQHSSEGSGGAVAPNKPPRDPKSHREMKESGSLSSSPPASTTSPSENLVYADVDHGRGGRVGRGGRGGGGGGRSRPPQQQQQPGVEYSAVTQGQTTEGLTYALIDHAPNLVYADVDHRRGGGGGRGRPPQQQQLPGVEYSTTEGFTFALIDHNTRNNPKPKPNSRVVQYSALKQ